jgi:hypothetical protein
VTTRACGTWAKTYRYGLGLFFDLRSFLSVGDSCSPGSRQLGLVLENRARFTVVFSHRVLQHLTCDAFLQETRDLGAPLLTIFLLRLSLTTTSLGGSFLGSVLDLVGRISGSEPPVRVLLSVVG